MRKAFLLSAVAALFALVLAAPSGAEQRDRMTGGGFVGFNSEKARLGLDLPCVPLDPAANLQVTWQGFSFHLEELTDAECAGGNQPTGGGTHEGGGTGRCNPPGFPLPVDADAEWTLTDGGKTVGRPADPGRPTTPGQPSETHHPDEVRLTITSSNPLVPCELELDGVLEGGQLQFHG